MIKLKIKDIVYLLLYAIPNTLLSFGIVYIINNSLSGTEQFLKDYMIIAFFAIICYSYILNIIFQKALNKYTFKMLYDNEKKLFNQILEAPLIILEKFGSRRFYTAMEDLRLFSTLPYTVTHTISSLLMLVLGVIYMFTLSTISAVIVLVLIALVALCYFLVMKSMGEEVGKLRKLNEHYYGYVNDLLSGFKELKMSFTRRTNLLKNHLGPNRDKSEELDFRINFVFLSINLISQYGLYFIIAIILFGLPELGLLDREDVISYVVIILFISGPINNLINLQQTYTRFMVADKRIKNFIKDFQIEEPNLNITHTDDEMFESIEFKDIEFSYLNEKKEESFALGPINFKIEKGEILFVVGGNGSGKSTFINLLTGLYESSNGEIILNEDEKIIIKEDIQDSISSVFTSNHIFSKNYDDYSLENNKDYKELLNTMKMDGVIQDHDDASVRRNFSKGQSKRIALIFALLEKKPILVLDEWAADQDPHFRKYFYEYLIPKLKKEGKTIIAVTHDDSYFHVADRVIKFDYGKIVEDVKTNESKLLNFL